MNNAKALNDGEELDLRTVLQALPGLTGGEDISPAVVEPAIVTTTTRITKAEVGLIKTFLFHVGAEQRTKKEISDLLTAILRKPRFAHLKLSQLRRVTSAYIGEMTIRRGVGSLFMETTLSMRNNKAGSESPFATFAAVTALCRMKAFADCNEYNGMPAKFYEFLSRVVLFHEGAARAVFEGAVHKDNILWPADMERIQSFVTFGRIYLLGYYQQCWQVFSLKENTPAAAAQAKGRPDLSLADLELQMTLERRSWRFQDHPMLRLFFATTFARVCVPQEGSVPSPVEGSGGGGGGVGGSVDSAHSGSGSGGDSRTRGAPHDPLSQLFTPIGGASTAYPPLFVSLADAGDYSALKSAIFAAFESTYYLTYTEHLMLQAHERDSFHKKHPTLDADAAEDQVSETDRDLDDVQDAQEGLQRARDAAALAAHRQEYEEDEDDQQEDDDEGEEGRGALGEEEVSSVEGSDAEYGPDRDEPLMSPRAASPEVSAAAKATSPSRSTTTNTHNYDDMVVYYIAGAALRASLGIVQSACAKVRAPVSAATRATSSLLNHFTLPRASAEAAGLPVLLLSQRECGDGRMVYVSTKFHELVVDVEHCVLQPSMANPFAACMLGNEFGVYLYAKLENHNAHNTLECMFLSALQSTGAAVVGEESSVSGEESECVYDKLTLPQAEHLSCALANKFWTFYMKVVMSEYVKHVKSSTTYSNDINKLAFRVQALLENVRIVPVVSSV